ncbi:MAG: Flp pilus assembly complex ATPase component TadA [Coriobacteriia bacterium]|nr:Flp pilus assembly complex ATPase component TadA [Coriobacteriia bacterium]
MSPGSSISGRVLDSLVSAGLMTAEQVSSVREAASAKGVHVGVVLAERDLVSPADVASVLESEMGVPQVDLSSYSPEEEAIALVSAQIARGWKVLPLFEIEGMLTVAIGDPMDVFALDSVAGELGLELEPVLTDGASFATMLDQHYPEGAPGGASQGRAEARSAESSDLLDEQLEEAPAVPIAPEADTRTSRAAEVSAAGNIEQMVADATADKSPAAIDLDVLAVADSRKVSVLVADILDHAASRGAARIELLPYKDDFFLVYRVKGALEKVSSAPLSLQGALVDGFKQYARLSGVPPTHPALGRIRTRIGDKDRVLTVSVVPTIAGQRMVVTLAPLRDQPRGLQELGMPEAETRALHAMVERGRGILLVCSPVSAGSSTTYYALIAHAAASGKTVYSVEPSVDYEIASAAQVMVEPGGPSVEAYMAAGMRQDTDVLAVDGLRTVEDVHLAVEAAGMGKLVVVTFPAADIAAGVRRMLDLGVEPHSLASALAIGVGQRLVRLNCPNCSMETDGVLAAKIPGATKGFRDKKGSGCPNCGKSGFKGATAIFEVLPFTESVRTTISRAGWQAEIATSAAESGMRTLASAGLTRVKSGEVSAEELNRVLRFAE